MKDLLAIAVVAVAALFLFLAARSVLARGRKAASPQRRAAAKLSPGRGSAGAKGAGHPEGELLVAILTAAVSAASGMGRGTFRLAGITPARGSSGSSGFNTPAWGHVDRLKLGE